MALIPADVGLRMRLDNELQPQQVAPVKGLPADLPRLQAGQVFTAQIRDVLPQNTYLALVAGRQITLSLPENVKSGDVLELVVIEQTPNAVIARRTDPGNLAQTTPQTTLSQTAQMLRSVLVQEGETPAAVPLNRGQPLLLQPPQDAAELAPALSKAVAQSGLFYESHQAQWVAGKLSLANLRQEPQGQQPTPHAPLAATNLPTPSPSLATALASTLPAAARATQTSSATASPLPGATPTTTPGGPAASLPPQAGAQTPLAQPLLPQTTQLPPGLLLYQSNQSQPLDTPAPPLLASAPENADEANAPAANNAHPALSGQSASASSVQKEAVSDVALLRVYTHTASSQAASPIPEELRTLVQQQLDASGAQRLLWHGEIWPEQKMQWQLEWQQQGHQEGEGEESLPWKTNLRLTMPRLGTVDATLQLGPAGVRISLNADDAGSAAEMRDKIEELTLAMEAAGLSLLGMTVWQTPESAS